MDDKYEAAEKILEIKNQIEDLVYDARQIASQFLDDEIYGFDAYVFDQIREHLTKCNRYNQDLEDVAKAVENSGDEDDDENDM